MNRDVSTQKELGAFVHDARMKLGLTQEALADRAGVSRKWLIGLEQGVRTRAELGKVLDTFEALGISINLSFNAETEIESSDEGRYHSIARISPAASEAIRKATSLDQSSSPRLAPSNIGQSAFQKLAASGLGESSFQKFAKELRNQTGIRNLAASDLGQSALQQSLRKGLPSSDASTFDRNSSTANDVESEQDQALLDNDECNEPVNKDENNEQGPR
ncbi:helix-turn-helix domain-containing protein [Glutamicibacter arilaitensis]|uniref:helix-turn-helix domain-containing protein n=1 Tax=Glutamicibacter arilaitensis TaxID=256701 RepID=UPI003F8E00A4